MLLTKTLIKCVAAALGAALLLSACGNGDSAGSSAGSAAADLTAAQAMISPYLGKPSAFPIDTPLARAAAGKRIAYLDCGSPICGLFFAVGEPAAEQLGMKLTRIKAGLTADSVSAAFATVVQGRYDGVFVPAIQPSLWQRGLDQLVAAGIPVVTSGVVGAEPGKVAVGMLADAAIDRAGKLLAAYAVAKSGDKTDVVFYSTPETAFNPVLEKVFAGQVAALCGRCRTRTVKVPEATLGTRSPALITDDLQAHPKTTTAVFAQAAQTVGLPQALKTAGIKIETIATFPDPAQLQLIKNGDLSAGLGIDIPVIAWTLMDSLARLTTGQQPARGAKQDTPPMQFLTAAELPGDVSHGWTGYPDFPQRFAALWKIASP